MRRVSISGRRAVAASMALSALALSACLTISDPVEGLSVFAIVGGNNQSIVVGTIAPSPLSVQALDHAAALLPGITVDWIISSGAGTLSAASTVTGEDGMTAINFTASASPGPVLVRATAEDLRLTFTVNVTASLAPREN